MKRGLVLALSGLLFAATGAEATQLNLMQKMELRRACQHDFQLSCGDQKPGEGRLAQCIRENASKFSEPCRKAIDEARSNFPDATEEAMDY
jgi:hypothetical protein